MIMVIGIEQNFVQSFLRGQGSYYDYTHAWTKLRNEVVSWIFGALYACRCKRDMGTPVLWGPPCYGDPRPHIASDVGTPPAPFR